MSAGRRPGRHIETVAFDETVRAFVPAPLPPDPPLHLLPLLNKLADADMDAYSSRRAEIEAAMGGRGLGGTAENQHLARRAALMTRAAKRDVDRDALRCAGAGRNRLRVTDDAQALKERLEAVTGERIPALEGIGESVRAEHERDREKDAKAPPDRERASPERSVPPSSERESSRKHPGQRRRRPSRRCAGGRTIWT